MTSKVKRRKHPTREHLIRKHMRTMSTSELAGAAEHLFRWRDTELDDD